MLKRTLLILMVCAGLFVAGCGDDDSSSDSTANGDTTATTTESTTTPEEASKGKKPQVKPPKGPPPKELVEKDLKVGTGAEAKSGDEVTVQYVGVGYQSGTEFDSSWEREPFTFTLGKGEVIRGWDLGVEGMKVGGRRELIIPPNLAYGSEGSGTIAPNATLVFVVDLLGVK